MTLDGIPLLAVTIPLAGVIGLFVGSFLNVVIYRTPLGLSVAAPRSFCPTCQRQLKWWENVPVASWAALRGRCRTCHQPISVRYPLVELAAATSFALVTWGWSGTIVSAAYCVLAASMIAVGLIEYGGLRAPLSIAAIGTGAAQLVILVGAGWQGQWRIVIGSLVGSVVAILVFAALRALDPECVDVRGHGRSALLIAGCWLGGLGWISGAIGVSVWIAVFLACMVGTWSVYRQRSEITPGPNLEQHAHPLLATPLVSAIAVAMVASLIAGG
jgi:leader peptidase (prepilin peptidase)/N-methyltransferase